MHVGAWSQVAKGRFGLTETSPEACAALACVNVPIWSETVRIEDVRGDSVGGANAH